MLRFLFGLGGFLGGLLVGYHLARVVPAVYQHLQAAGFNRIYCVSFTSQLLSEAVSQRRLPVKTVEGFAHQPIQDT